MKKIFSLLSLMLVLLASCESTHDDGVTRFTILSEGLMEFDFRAGQGVVRYEIKNPMPDVSLVVTADGATWIYDIKTDEGKALFSIERNSGEEERYAILTFTYGEFVEQVAVCQTPRPEGAFDYDVTATMFGGEYLSLQTADDYNYYVQVGTGEIDYMNGTPNATYYYFDIFSKFRGGMDPILPNGTYTLDTSNKFKPGSFSAQGSMAHINNEYGEHAVEFKMSMGTVTVTDNKFEATVHMTDGTIHHIVFEGTLYVPFAVSYPTPDIATTLTEDLIFNHTGSTMRLFYYGDYYECGYDYWRVALMQTMNPINGDYFMIDIITDAKGEGADPENVLGTYAACSDFDIKPNSFLIGVMEGASYINSWRLVVEDDYIVNGNGRVPLTTGSVKIEKDGGSFVVTIDSMDDGNNKVQGTFSCGGYELYDRSNR